MKNFLFIVSLIFLLVGCDNEQTATPEPVTIATPEDSIQNYKGNFISAGDAAVLKGNQFVYQVKIDSTARALKDSLKGYKTGNGSLIPVEVTGKVTDNPSSVGYSQIIEIKEVVEIFAEKQPETEEQK